MADLAVMRDRLRKETAELLGLDINALSAAQSVRLDRCSTLRLEIDDIESRKLQGVAFDAVKYIAVSEALERMVGGNPEQTNTTHDFTGAKEELARLLNQRGSAIEHCEQRESARLREQVAQLREEITQLRAQLRAPPQQPSEKQRPENVVSIDAARAAERAADERAWRNYTYNNGGGVLIAPGINIDPRR